MKTIDAMKMPQPYCNAHNECDQSWPYMFSESQVREFAKSAVSVIKREEAQTVEPVAWQHKDGNDIWVSNGPSGSCNPVPLFTHPAKPHKENRNETTRNNPVELS